jgi:predicted nucleic acid-binding protein
MILVDTSVWLDHLHHGEAHLVRLLDDGEALTHPSVVGEIALGNLRQREIVLNALQKLPQAAVASDTEVLQLIARHKLFGFGIGYVDVHLLAAVRLTPGALLWTRDKRAQAAAELLGVASGRDA